MFYCAPGRQLEKACVLRPFVDKGKGMKGMKGDKAGGGTCL